MEHDEFRDDTKQKTPRHSLNLKHTLIVNEIYNVNGLTLILSSSGTNPP